MNRTNAAQTEYPVWDIAKLIMAFLVIGIHTGTYLPNTDVDFYIKEWLARFSVPMFFCIAGNFLYQKLSSADPLSKEDGVVVRRYAFRMLRMYLIWTLIYFIPQLYQWIHDGVTVHDLLIWVEYAVVRGDSYIHLWYLSSLFTAVFLLWILHRRLRLKYVFCIAIVLYCFGLLWLPHHYLIAACVDGNPLLSAVHTFLNRFFGWPRNGIFFGLVFVCMGAWIAKGEAPKLRRIHYILLSVLFVGLSFAEVWQIRRHNGAEAYCALTFCMLPSVWCLFHALQGETRLQPRPIYRTLRKCSTYIYCIHPMVLFFVKRFPIGTFIGKAMTVPFVLWVFVFCISFAIAALLVWLEYSRHLKFLRVLH